MPGQEMLFTDDDGREVWTSVATAPVFDATGQVTGAVTVVADIDAQKRSAEALRESEERFRAVADLAPDLLWSALPTGEGEWFSSRWTAYTGESAQRLLAWGWMDFLHPDDIARTTASIDASLHNRADYEVEFRLRRADGAYRWFLTRATPIRDEAGRILRWFGVCTDIEDIRSAQERQSLLLAELQHRVRNVLAVVRSIARRTAASSETVDDYAAHLDGRLNALARTQAAVTRDPAAGLSIEQILGEELLAYATREGGQAQLCGPAVRLRPKAAETLALAVHELATNSVKYGALASKDGQLLVRWSVEDRAGAPWLKLDWAETGEAIEGGPPVRRGFGTELLERTLAYDLKAKTTLAFDPGAFRCTVAFPLTNYGIDSA